MAAPIQSVLDLTDRVVRDLEKVGTESVGLAGDGARVALEAVQMIKDKTAEIETAILAAIHGQSK
jgi:hypothetical protein